MSLVCVSVVDLRLTSEKTCSGHNLTIEAAGVVKKDIKEGAYVELVVKYGFIQLIQTTVDLCEQIRSIGLDCPIKAGETTITKSVALPQEIPPVRRSPPPRPSWLPSAFL